VFRVPHRVADRLIGRVEEDLLRRALMIDVSPEGNAIIVIIGCWLWMHLDAVGASIWDDGSIAVDATKDAIRHGRDGMSSFM
jgi:hypothetical protein